MKETAIARIRNGYEHLQMPFDRTHRNRQSAKVCHQQLIVTVETEWRIARDTCKGLEQRVQMAGGACAKAMGKLKSVR